MTRAAPVVKPLMTERDRKLVRKPRRSRPTAAYMRPTSSEICAHSGVRQCDGLRSQSTRGGSRGGGSAACENIATSSKNQNPRHVANHPIRSGVITI